MSALLRSLQAQFEALPPALVEAQGLGGARRAALAAALAQGLPGPRVEAWKYTSLRALGARAFQPAAAAPAAGPGVAGPGAGLDIPAPRLVWTNGRYDAAASDLSGLPEGLELRPLSQALAGDDPRAVAVLGRVFARRDELFARLNAALATDGVLLRAPAGLRSPRPLHLVFVGADAGADLAPHLRHLIELREEAELSVVEHHLDAGRPHRHLLNHLVHVHLARGARLSHVRLQSEGSGASLFTRTDAVLAADADYRRVDLELGAALSRHELNVALQGERAAVTAGGVLVGSGRRHLDTRLQVEHQARDTRCELPWRGLAGDRARVAFHGGITIRAGADGSDANLSSRNLLLSDGAEIDSQPVLVIHADEVKAAHGATVGRLDEAALFYLRSRGLPRADAQRLLQQAFLREPLALLPAADLREDLARFLALQLGAAPETA